MSHKGLSGPFLMQHLWDRIRTLCVKPSYYSVIHKKYHENQVINSIKLCHLNYTLDTITTFMLVLLAVEEGEK